MLSYHRKSAIRALSFGETEPRRQTNTGRPVRYNARTLTSWLKETWQANDYACNRRLAAMLPEWIPASVPLKLTVNSRCDAPRSLPSSRDRWCPILSQTRSCTSTLEKIENDYIVVDWFQNILLSNEIRKRFFGDRVIFT